LVDLFTLYCFDRVDQLHMYCHLSACYAQNGQLCQPSSGRVFQRNTVLTASSRRGVWVDYFKIGRHQLFTTRPRPETGKNPLDVTLPNSEELTQQNKTFHQSTSNQKG